MVQVNCSAAFCVSGPVLVSWLAVLYLGLEHSHQGSKTTMKNVYFQKMLKATNGQFVWLISKLCSLIHTYHRVGQSHADLLVLNIGVI